MSKYAITSGTIAAPVKTVLYGPEGIGKSTFAAQFPAPVFIDTEGGTKLDPAIVERAAGKIIQADSVRLFGVNASSLVAQDLYYKLIRIGKSACYAQDLHIQLTYAATMGPKDVGIFVSNSGTTREVMECLHLAAARGGTTIALTRFDNSPLAQAADLCLYTSSPEISHRSGAMSSRIAQMCMVDVLFTAVARRNYRKVETALENSYKSCMTHRVEAEN